jgi:hypothetical protein
MMTLHVKVPSLAFINAFVNAPADLKTRQRARTEFNALGLNTLLEEMNRKRKPMHFPIFFVIQLFFSFLGTSADPDVRTQASVFLEEAREDEAEAKSAPSSSSSMSSGQSEQGKEKKVKRMRIILIRSFLPL